MQASPSTNVFVGQLPAEISDEMVSEIFGAYGGIASVKAMPSKVPGGRGAAMITFASVEEAKWIVENLNGNIAQGLTEPIVVKFGNAKGQKGCANSAAGDHSNGYGKSGGCKGSKGQLGGDGPYSGKGGRESGGKPAPTDGSCSIHTLLKGLSPATPGGGKVPDDNQVYITGLPVDTTDLDLYKMFAPFGAIQQRGVKAMRRPEDSSCSGVGFVDFSDHAVAQQAIMALNGTMMPDGAVLRVQAKNSTRKGGPGKGMSMMGMGKGW